MPVDHNKAFRQARRARGEIACAECRRLKLRCDKQIPCSSCVRRGCPMICPNGNLTGGQGTRFVLADTDQLHQKLIAMSERIRQLEDALLVAVPTGPGGSHPLLREDLLAIKFGIDEITGKAAAPQSEEPEGVVDPSETLDEALGTLAISEGGGTRFIGTTGGTISYMLEEREDLNDGATSIPTINGFLADTWPFTPIPNTFDKSELLSQLLTYLPSKERVSALSEALFENMIWATRLISRPQVVEELTPAVYGHAGEAPENRTVDFHDLALLFMICAMGAVADLTQDPANEEGLVYYTCARAALSLKSIFEDTTLATVQAMHMMNDYSHFLRSRPVELSWLTLNLVQSLSISMGLHRDPARWNLEKKISTRRCTVFWETFVLDAWKSLTMGRPPFFSLPDIDCPFPDQSEDPKDINEGRLFRTWYYKFGKEILHPIAKRMMSTVPLKHSDILELDRKVREYPLYAPAVEMDNRPVIDDSPGKAMWALTPAGVREYTLLYLHRAFFAKAMLQPSVNPLRGSYAASFLSSYRSAITILKHVRKLFGLFPHVASRCWFLWHHAFCSLIMISSIVAMKPDSDLAPVGLAELGLSVEMYEKAVQYSSVHSGNLPTILRLRSRAYQAYMEQRDVNPLIPSKQSTVASDFSRELALLGGQTRRMFVKDVSSAAPKQSTQRVQNAPTPIPQIPIASTSTPISTSSALPIQKSMGSMPDISNTPSMFTSSSTPNMPDQHYSDDLGAASFATQYQEVDETIYDDILQSFSSASAQSFDQADFFGLFAGTGTSSSNSNGSPAEIPQDTWDALVTETGVYQQQGSIIAPFHDINAWSYPAMFPQ